MKKVQLGFSLCDVAIHLPAAILIYEAESEKILFANSELISMFGCEDLEDFLRYTNQNFRGVVHPDDYEKAEESIWRQIFMNRLKGCADDAVNYLIITKQGKIVWVIDRGRLVNSAYYGKIFYVVLITDDEMNEEK
ncbi:PAS domain-containing protein [Mitsuokella sp.]